MNDILYFKENESEFSAGEILVLLEKNGQKRNSITGGTPNLGISTFSGILRMATEDIERARSALKGL